MLPLRPCSSTGPAVPWFFLTLPIRGRANAPRRRACPGGQVGSSDSDVVRRRAAAGSDDTFFSTTKCTFSLQSIFYPLFLNEDGKIREKRLSKLHYRFRRYSTLTTTVLLESQYLQSYDSLPDFLRPNFEEYRHNFADIDIQAKLS